ncbi:hypothetical protein CRG98_037631 [Punica granatum]|uniref:Uncharacterized protein n=1 Tax=Punica granatum TaxID=22663 RepID=A0A2I0IDY5_PUNGR|nr:hypothetical protein CRG98_037631 [Punica granatum]
MASSEGKITTVEFQVFDWVRARRNVTQDGTREFFIYHFRADRPVFLAPSRFSHHLGGSGELVDPGY